LRLDESDTRTVEAAIWVATPVPVAGIVVNVTSEPREALNQLRNDARSGQLTRLCRETGIELLVAFGSATDPDWPLPPRDLDLAVVLTSHSSLLQVLDALATHLGFERIDLMDLGRAGDVARAQALGRGELLYELTPGTFAEQQILALVKQADTRWLRDLQLAALSQ
jgi:hypothetical protein